MSLNGGYAMIKYNSTQEELQIAYRSKKPALFYDENQRAHWAVIEETATQSVDEETQEPITLYEYSYRLLDEASGGGSTVIANPTLNGDEATLDGLEVDGTKYKVGGGSGTITLDDIVDKNGNKRFVEGNGIIESNVEFNSKYCKWSLSGTHLMCVLSASLSANTILPSQTLATFTVPDYIGSKIITTWSNRIIMLEPYIKDSEGAGDTIVVLVNYYNNNITFELVGRVAAINRERYFRIQFDMLIDSE